MQSRAFRIFLAILNLSLVSSPFLCAQEQAPPTQDQIPQIIHSAPIGELPTANLNSMPGCISNAQSGYAGGKCIVYINRLAPISPPALIVPKNTTVYVVVYNTRWNEAITFASALSKTTTPDIAAAALKNSGTPLQSIVLSITRQNTSLHPYDSVADTIGDLQRSLSVRLNTLQDRINRANAKLTCLSNYESLQIAPADQTKYSCSQANLLNPTSFAATAVETIAEATNFGQADLPVMLVKRMDGFVDDAQVACVKTSNDADGLPNVPSDSGLDPGGPCFTTAAYMANRAIIDSALTSIQSAQATLAQSVRVLKAWPGTPTNVAYEFKSQRLTNLVLTISGQEILNKVNSPIASVTINTQANPFVISTGLAFSNLKYHTYLNAPIIDANGNPVLDSSGKVTTVVTQQTQSPSVIAPLALFSYRLSSISHAGWENKCPNGCSVLLSGGIGANLTSKTADFDIGPSFQIGGFLLTPTIHFGRDTRLSNGIQVGQKLGSSPPSTLPTENSWVVKWGFALTYSVPIP